MLKSSRKKVTAALVAAALVAAAVALAVGTAAATHSHRVGTRSAVLPHGLADRIESNRRALARSFPLLTAAHAASVRALSLPEPFQREFAEQATKSVPAGALGEPDPAMAVYIGQVSSAATGALNVWAMPGPNDLCLARIPITNKGAAVECQSNAAAAAGGLVGVDGGSNGGSTVLGLLPGDASQVTVHRSGGADVVVPATEGLFVINNDPRAAGVSTSTLSRMVPLPSLTG
jgi:hypothetical protein